MSREIDERIVAMHFDNDQFEKGARQSLKTLDELKQGLDFEGVGESFEQVSKVASKGFGLKNSTRQVTLFSRAINGMGKVAKSAFGLAASPIENLYDGFKTLEGYVGKVFGINIASKLLNTGEQVIRAFTIDPMKSGWNEYELKMDSIKTIMTGTMDEFKRVMGDDYTEEAHLNAVKSALEELNKYADDTIYSFQDMTSNIGKFTNNGVKLNDAVSAMKGISNAAALAGQGTQQASMAMYNLSQAISVGKLTTMDWKSIENANMATLQFKQTFIDMAAAMGKLEKKGDKFYTKTKNHMEVTAENFRNTLSEGWADTDVITAALKVFSGDYLAVDLVALGVPEELALQMEKLGQEAKEAATQVRTFTKMWDALKEAAQSGWAMSWEYIFGDMNEATKLWSSLNDRFSSWLDSSADARNNLLRGWRGFVTDSDADKLAEALEKFSGISWEKYAKSDWFKSETKFKDIIDGALEILNSKGSTPEAVAELIEYLKNDYSLTGKDASAAIDAILNVYRGLDNIGVDGRELLIEAANNLLDTFEIVVKLINDSWKSVFGEQTAVSLQGATKRFKMFTENFKTWFGDIDDETSNINKLSKNLRGLFSILKLGKTAVVQLGTKGFALLTKILPDFGKVLDKLAPINKRIVELANQFAKDGSFTNLFNAIKQDIKKGWGKTKVSIKQYWDEIKAAFGEGGLGAVIKKVKGDLRSYLEKEWGVDFSPFDSLKKSIGESWTKTKTSIKEYWNELWEIFAEKGLTGVISKVKTDVNKYFTENWGIDFLLLAQQIEASWNSAKTSIEGYWSDIKATFSNNGLGGVIEKVKSDLRTYLEEKWKIDFTGVDELVANLKTHLGYLESALESFFGLEDGSIAKWIDKIGDMIGSIGKKKLPKNPFERAAVLVKTSISDQIDQIHSFFGIEKDSKTSSNSIFGDIDGTISFIDRVTGIFESAKERITSFVDWVKTADWSDIGQSFKDAIAQLGSGLMVLGSGAALFGAGRFINGIGGAPKRLTTITASLGNLAEFSMGKSALDKVSDALGGASDFLKSTASIVLEFAGGIWLLSDAIGKLAEIDEADLQKAGNAIGNMAGLVAVFQGVSKAENALIPMLQGRQGLMFNFGKVSKVGKFAEVEASNIKDAVSFVLQINTLVNSLIKLTEIDQSKLTKAGNALAQLGGFALLFQGIGQLENVLTSGMTGNVLSYTGKKLNFSQRDTTQRVTNLLDAVSFIMEINTLVDSLIKLTEVDQSKLTKAGNALAQLGGFALLFQGIGQLENVLTSGITGNVWSFSGKNLKIFNRQAAQSAISIDDATAFVTEISALVSAFSKLADIDQSKLTKAGNALAQLGGFALMFQGIGQFENVFFSGKTGNILSYTGKKLNFSQRDTTQRVTNLLDAVSFIMEINTLVDSLIKLTEIDQSKLTKAGNALGQLGGFALLFQGIGQLENVLTSGKTGNVLSYTGKKLNFSQRATTQRVTNLLDAVSFIMEINTLVDSLIKLAEIDQSKLTKAGNALAQLGGFALLFQGIGQLENVLTSGKTGNILSYTGKKLNFSQRDTTQRVTNLLDAVSFIMEINTLVDSLIKLTEIDQSKLDKAGKALAQLGGFALIFQGINGVENMISSSFNNKAGIGSLQNIGSSVANLTDSITFVNAISGMVSAVVSLAKVDPDRIDKAVEALTVISTLFEVIQAINDLETMVFDGSAGKRLVGSVSSLFSVVGLVVGLTALVLAIKELTKVEDPAKLDSAADVVLKLGGILTGFGALITLSSMVSSGGAMFKGAATAALSIIEFIAIIGALGGVIGVVLESVFGTDKVVETLNHASEVMFAIGNLLGSFISGIVKPIASVFKGEEHALTDTPETFLSMTDSLEELSLVGANLNIEGIQRFKEALDILKQVADERVADPTWFDTFFNGEISVEAFVSKLPGMSEDLSSFMSEMSGVSGDGLVEITQAIKNIAEAFASFGQASYDSYWISSFLDDISETIGTERLQSVVDVFSGLHTSMNEGLEESATLLNVQPIIDAIISGIDNGGVQVKASISRLFENGNSEIESDATEDASSYIDTVNATLAKYGISMPEEYLTDYYSKISSGITSQVPDVYSLLPEIPLISDMLNGKDLAESYKNAYGGIKSGITDLAQDAGLSLAPTLDLGQFSAVFQGGNVMIKGEVSIDSASLTTITNGLTSLENTAINQTNRIVSEISSLNDRIGGLESAINNIQIVLDTGAIASAVDQKLGARMALQDRVAYA